MTKRSLLVVLNVPLYDIWKLILNNMTWIQLPTTSPNPATASAQQIIGGFLYIFGGKTLLNDGLNVTGGFNTSTATPALSPIQIYDMNNNQWISACPVSQDRKSTRLNSSHIQKSRMPSSA